MTNDESRDRVKSEVRNPKCEEDGSRRKDENEDEEEEEEGADLNI